MSERGVSFIERWISENIASEQFIENGDDARLDAFAEEALLAALQSGIAREDILEEFPDLPSRIAEAIQGAADRELRRQIDEE